MEDHQFSIEGLNSDHEIIYVTDDKKISTIQLLIDPLKHPKANDAPWMRDRVLETLSKIEFQWYSLIIAAPGGLAAWTVNSPDKKSEPPPESDPPAKLEPKPKKPLGIKSSAEAKKAAEAKLPIDIEEVVANVLEHSVTMSDVFFENTKAEREAALRYLRRNSK